MAKRNSENRPTSASCLPGLTQVEMLLKQGLFGAAREAAQLLAQRRPSLESFMALARAEQGFGDYESALTHARTCRSLAQKDIDVIILEARLLYSAGRHADVITACNAGLSLQPELRVLLVLKAAAMAMCHDFQGAWEVIAPAISESSGIEVVDVATRALHGLERYAEAIRLAEPYAGNPRQPAESRWILWLQAFSCHDRLKQHDAAMDACKRAHEVVRTPFDGDAVRSRGDEVIQMFNPQSLRMFARATHLSELPMFVSGMPRSGTSMVEQIVSCHPDVFGAGELNDIERISRTVTSETASVHSYPNCLGDMTVPIANQYALAYTSRLQSLDQHALRVTDKMLGAWDHVGLIWMLLPRSRMIHVVRDPMDTCFSCYTRPLRMPYVTSMESLGFVYREHERLMAHWKRTLDLPILTVQYEDLVANQERITRQIVEFAGLEWNESCLKFWQSKRKAATQSFDQVNKPIYDSSIGRWKNYEKHLGPLKKALGLEA